MFATGLGALFLLSLYSQSPWDAGFTVPILKMRKLQSNSLSDVPSAPQIQCRIHQDLMNCKQHEQLEEAEAPNRIHGRWTDLTSQKAEPSEDVGERPLAFFFFFSIFSFICSLSSFLYLFHFILSQIRLRFSTFVSIVAVRFTLRSPREVTYYFHFQFKHLRERNLIGSVWEKYSSLGQSTGDKKAVWCLKNGSQGCRWG